MWLNEAGGANTISLPEPREWVDPIWTQLKSISRQYKSEKSFLTAIEVLEDAFDETLDRHVLNEVEESQYEWLHLPEAILEELSGHDYESLGELVDATPWRWRLDVITLLDEWAINRRRFAWPLDWAGSRVGL
jgi:hypothetical protein